MVGLFTMETDEVPSIKREKGSFLRTGERQDLRVRHRLAGLSRLGDGQHIVAEMPQRSDGGQREVLVGIESRRWSGVLVLLDLAIDLIAVSTHIGPRIHEILCSKGRIAA